VRPISSNFPWTAAEDSFYAGIDADDVLIVGIGHPARGDDGAGPWVANVLAPYGFRARVLARDGLALIDAWTGLSHAIVVDAVALPGAAGSIIVLDGLKDVLPTEAPVSSHGFGLAEAVRLGRSLNGLPTRLLIYGIGGEDFAIGRPLAGAVRRGAARIARRIMVRLRSAQTKNPIKGK
jgi:hydrogenase maturation protease